MNRMCGGRARLKSGGLPELFKKLIIFGMNDDACIPRLTVQDWTLLQARLVWAYEGEVAAKNLRQRSARRHLAAWFIEEGEATVRMGGKRWTATEGRWLLAGPEHFDQEFSAGARIVSVNFLLEWPSGDSLVGEPLVLDGAEHPALLRAARALVKFVRKKFPRAHTELWRESAGLEEFFGLQDVFSTWVLAYLRAVLAAGVTPVRMRGTEPRVLDVLRRLDRQPWSAPFVEKELAGAVGLSAGHLDRLFMRDVGMTPRAYLQKRRREAALAALADPTVPVKQIAHELGFGSASHFSHWMRKNVGRSPRASRQDALAALSSRRS